MLYVPEMTSSEGLQSVIDFINHAPAQRHLEIFTLIANEEHITVVQKIEETLSKSGKTICLYVLKQDSKIEISINLKQTS